MDDDPQTWRELLKRLVEDPKMREQILRQTGVQPITLTRWIQGPSKPHHDAMRTLLKIVPYPAYPLFLHLVAADFPDLASEPTRNELALPDPPIEFYTRMLNAHATTPPTLYPQSLRDLQLQQMMKHFDPNRLGMSISIARCMTPQPGQKVRSLQVVDGISSAVGNMDPGRRAVFLGAESLAGAAVSANRLIGIANRADDHMNPAHWIEDEQCAMAYPIMYRTRIAGALIVEGSQPYMFGVGHHTLLENYAHLMALAFDASLFYDSADIALRLMPHYRVQQPILQRFNARAIQKVAKTSDQSMVLSAAQERVWQEIEEELLAMATSETQ